MFKKYNDLEFNTIIKELIENENVLKMNNFLQHFDTTCFEHCYNVSYNCYNIAKKLDWDYISITRAGMLHDLFLYDWRKKNPYGGLHAFVHGKIACNNACKIFKLTKKEKNIIRNHMFPITIIPPKSKEGLLLTIIDKYCTISEMNSFICKRISNNTFYIRLKNRLFGIRR